MNAVEVEKKSNRLKGVASILSMMGEAKGSMVWSEWAVELLVDEMEGCINKLDDMLEDNVVQAS